MKLTTPTSGCSFSEGGFFTKDTRIRATTMRPFVRGSFNEQEAYVRVRAHTQPRTVRASIVSPKTNIKAAVFELLSNPPWTL